MRLDKWLWAARLFKTRSLAAEAVERGRVDVNGAACKPARELRVGDRVRVRQPPFVMELVVRGLSAQRGPAPVARELYEETPDSAAARERLREQRRVVSEPADSLEHGRPTKRDRRALADWQRWSASIDDDERR